ncbi:MAG: type II toxin-antitoxin system Phd/YefM family antitoxin [Pirellulales bacterium]|nr:type II toxin-antitoxin system Phd/YefM family antitoxin [Pirellulales bacterium]
MKTMAISEFKAHCLQVFSNIARTKEPVIVTKRGKPLVEVIPFRNNDQTPEPGKLSHTLVFEDDIVSPLGESIWSACK